MLALHAVRAGRARSSLRGLSSRSIAVATARAGNLVRFLAPTGTEHWGTLTDPRASKPIARVVDDVLEAPWTAGNTEVEISRVLAPLPVFPAPAVIIIGLNYRSHAAETGKELPRFPVFAYKNPSSVAGPEDAISIPSCAREKPEVDFEGEMAIVLGRHVRDANAEEALNAVLGVTAANDVSARRWQGKKGGGQWSRAKSFDTFCPLGPSILPLGGASGVGAALAPSGEGLRLRTIVNGEVMQDCRTSDMMFGVGAIVSYLSQGTTLLPGTIILTGTPPGVGYVRNPPVYLAAGDRVEVELEGAGVLSNTVENGP
mmetsp:Transcript_74688/g.207652  ORF Transcript_74688/g.207652 Transcript_74688/m.207652 type:complete len:315 (+) Transcript_74688:68-1012(+)